MSQVSTVEIRTYDDLFGRADAARDPRELGLVAADAERQLSQWLLVQTLKDKLAERAKRFGIRCRDSESCFHNLLSRVRPKPMFHEAKPEDFDIFADYVLSPQEVEAQVSQISDTVRSGRTPISAIEQRRRIVYAGAIARGASSANADQLARSAVEAWHQHLDE